MPGWFALAAATFFTLLAGVRLRLVTRWTVPALLAGGLAGGLSAGLHWTNGADSRWLVAGVMLVLGAAAAPVGTRVAAMRVAALVLGMLATVLLTIATATAR